MKIKNVLSLGVIIIILSIYFSSAITGSIGNSRMVIRAAPGDTVEKYILIKNVNDVPITVDLLVGGDLVNSTILKDNSFNLTAGEEKKAYFVISSDKNGTYETKINIRFIPEEGSSVGLSSTVILIAGEEYTDNEDVITDLSDYEKPNIVSSTFKNLFDSASSESKEGSSMPMPLILLTISTIILAVILGALMFFGLKKKEGKIKSRKITLKHEK